MSERKKNLKLMRKEVRKTLQDESAKVAKQIMIKNKKLRRNIKILFVILGIENIGFVIWILINSIK